MWILSTLLKTGVLPVLLVFLTHARARVKQALTLRIT